MIDRTIILTLGVEMVLLGSHFLIILRKKWLDLNYSPKDQTEETHSLPKEMYYYVK